MDEVAKRAALMIGTLQLKLIEAEMRVEALTKELAKERKPQVVPEENKEAA